MAVIQIAFLSINDSYGNLKCTSPRYQKYLDKWWINLSPPSAAYMG